MRDAALAASDAVAEVQTEPRGTIRVTCPVTLAQTVLGELMPEFLKRCPLVQVEMQVTNRPVNLVEEGLMSLRVRATLEDSGSMVVKRLDSSRQILVASPDLLQRQGTPRSLEDLQLLDSMAMTAVDGHSSLLLSGPKAKEHRLQLQPRYVVDDLLTLKFAALAGSGMCWLPDYMCQDELTRGTLVQLLPHRRLRAASCMRCSSRRGLAPAVRHFLDFLGSACRAAASLPAKAASASAQH
jgi:DNA-binding transcriptional LysR family regulator